MGNTRRAFIAAVIGSAVAVGSSFVAPTPAPTPTPLRRIDRWQNGRWVRCRMPALRTGDVFRIEEVGTFRAHGNPSREPNGVWGIHADITIDPATNQWVPA